jgi:hypothetical protein
MLKHKVRILKDEKIRTRRSSEHVGRVRNCTSTSKGDTLEPAIVLLTGDAV